MRPIVESALRLVSIAALGTILWRWANPAPTPVAMAEVVESRALGDALTRWTTTSAGAAHLSLDSLPDPARRDWLRALDRAGMHVTWSATGGMPTGGMPTGAMPLAAAASPIADPAGGVRLEVSAPRETAVGVGDALAATDTIRTQGVGGAALLPSSDDMLVAHAPGATARLTSIAVAPLGTIVVLGRAGWEAKFVAAALEERGWAVRLRVPIAPGIDVRQGAVTFDSATAAVVVLDTTGVDDAVMARLARWVRLGGGLVLASESAASGSLRALAAGDLGAPIEPATNAIASATPQRGLVLRPIAPRADAIVVERCDAMPSVVARRVGAGRVVQTGYDETWRWRMADAEDAPVAHRLWWARVVAAAARVPNTASATNETLAAHAVSNDRSSSNDAAPLAATVAALGPPSAAPSTARRRLPTGPRPSDAALAALAGAALLAEVGSRRMRGKR